MKEFAIATFDQNLTLNGVKLEDNEKTLAQLNVEVGSIIELCVSVLLTPFRELLAVG